MTLAPQELENTASKFAAEAIKLDSQGSHSSAISSYQRATEALIKLVQIYPEYKLNRVYLERASAYQNRIKAIQMANGIAEDDRQQNFAVPYMRTRFASSLLNSSIIPVPLELTLELT